MSINLETIIATYQAPSIGDQPNRNDSISQQNNLCSFFSAKEAAFIFTLAWFFIWFFIIPLALYQSNNGTFEFKNIALNTVGDYLAGVAAPIAFLWLVLAYKQQSKELSINNEMLKLQHEELKSSVAAQVDQASSMKQQLDILIREKFHPKFKLQRINYDSSNDHIEMVIENIGNSVGSVSIVLDSDEMALRDCDTVEELTTIDIQTLSDMGKSFTIKFQVKSILETGMTIADYFKIDYNALRYNNSLDIYPPLERIQDIGQI